MDDENRRGRTLTDGAGCLRISISWFWLNCEDRRRSRLPARITDTAREQFSSERLGSSPRRLFVVTVNKGLREYGESKFHAGPGAGPRGGRRRRLHSRSTGIPARHRSDLWIRCLPWSSRHEVPTGELSSGFSSCDRRRGRRRPATSQDRDVAPRRAPGG